MDKETRNMLITGFVCCIVSFVVGIGVTLEHNYKNKIESHVDGLAASSSERWGDTVTLENDTVELLCKEYNKNGADKKYYEFNTITPDTMGMCIQTMVGTKAALEECDEFVETIQGVQVETSHLANEELLECKTNRDSAMSQLNQCIDVVESTQDVMRQTDNLLKQCMNLQGANYEIDE